MSVLASKRKTGDLTVIIKAKENAIYTLKITHNEKRFPKRYRFSVTNKLQDLAIDILTNLIQANEIYPRTTEEYQYRTFLQRKAMASCRALNTLIDVSAERFSLEKKAEELGLQLNEKKTKIVPITTGINFLGFRFYMTSTGKVVVRLKAKNKNRRRRKLRKQKKLLLQGKIRMEDIQQSYDSWKAHAKRGNTYYMLRDMDKYFYGLFKDFIKQGGEENGKTTK